MGLSDDEWITRALLLGAPLEEAYGTWYLCRTGAYHPVEEANFKATGDYGFKSAADLARAYCEHRNFGE